MAKTKTKWVCKECGNESFKFQGKCFGCGNFGTLEEVSYFTGKDTSTKSSKTINTEFKKAKTLNEIKGDKFESGIFSGIKEFDRVCGGKLTDSSVILLSGDPGNGKSTLISQVSNNVSKQYKVLYASGEETEMQIKNRMVRLKIEPNENLHLLHTTDMDNIEKEAIKLKPKLLIIDSINTVGSKDINSDPGDLSQMKHCISRILSLAKDKGITVIVIAQITKDGQLAGPKKLEHMVDTVLFLEGDKYNDLRYLKSSKSRFGSDKELGVFAMRDSGLVEIPNPSEYLLQNRPIGESGSAVVCISDVRPLLVEVQALVSSPGYENAIPRRTSEGFSRNRLNLLVAVLEKKCGLQYLSAKDIYVNVVNGINLKEPGTDLGVAMAIYSSFKNTPIKEDTVLLGEVGLAGEIRPVSKIEQIVKECERVGFSECILPIGSYKLANEVVKHMKLKPVRNLNECIKYLF